MKQGYLLIDGDCLSGVYKTFAAAVKAAHEVDATNCEIYEVIGKFLPRGTIDFVEVPLK